MQQHAVSSPLSHSTGSQQLSFFITVHDVRKSSLICVRLSPGVIYYTVVGPGSIARVASIYTGVLFREKGTFDDSIVEDAAFSLLDRNA